MLQTRALRCAALASAAAIAFVPVLGFAQDVTAADPEGPTQVQSSQDTSVDRSAADQGVGQDEIVVTGTILRGAAPTGSNLISVGEDRIQSQGATTANELLATVPQVSNLFNNVPTARLGVASNQIQVVRPNLRNLAGETSSSSSTLVLFDGHRIASVGVSQNAVDPDLIPPIAIERVEVVTDGGSATYGSDAVGGVINFITRKRFDGVKVQGRYGFADDYYQVDAGAIIGKDWGTGSVFAAYNYQHNDALFGRDRDFIQDVDFLSPNLTPRGRACSPGNVQIGAAFFALPALTSSVPNVCDPTDDTTVVPESTRHGAIAGLHQDLSDAITVDLRAFYGERSTRGFAPVRGGATVQGGALGARQFFYTPVGTGTQLTANQTVQFSFASLLGQNSFESGTSFEEWGMNAEFRINLGDNWQLRPLFNYSRSHSEFHIEQFNQSLLTQFGRGTTAATAINFYNPTAADLPLIQQLINSELAGETKDSLLDARVILDGSLFTLPGGDLKLAVGYEYLHDGFQRRSSPSDQVIGAIRSVAYTPYKRRIHSVFGEVNVPLVGEDNRMGFIHTLTLAGSVRHDRFSDFGNTTNPKIGVNFKPTSWLGLRGNYSTSFNAPSPNDQLGSLANNLSFISFLNAFVNPADTGANTPTVIGTVALQGSNPGLVPQTAKTYSLGIDLDPPFLAGLRASANYYNVKFKNIINIPTPGPGIFANFPNNVLSARNGLTLTQITDFVNGSGASAAQRATVLAQVTPRCNAAGICNVYELVDFRQGNYGSVDVEGIDFAASYRSSTGFGGFDLGVSGNYTLSRKSQTGVGAPVIDQLQATNLVLPNGLRIVNNAQSRLQLSATAGVDFGAFRTQATLNHSAGYDLVRCDPTTVPACTPSTTGLATSSGLPQDEVGAFNTVNLFFKYEVPGDSLLLSGLEFTLNINNVFDTDPPIFRQIANQQAGYANGFTLGRLVQFGISKEF
jgi:iron complex outermembrane recepter protein